MSSGTRNTRTALALALLMLVGGTCVSLGFWQLDRATERRAIAANIEQGRKATAIELNNATQEAHNFKNWTPATVQGRWRGDLSLLLDNRNLNGRPGLWLATPLVIADGRAVLVLRGWFARPLGENIAPIVPTSGSDQQLSGELAEHVPRLFELWSSAKPANETLAFAGPASSAARSEAIDTNLLPRRQNLAVAELSKVSGLNFFPVVLLQTSPANDGLIRTWPQPSVDADKNTGYAMQWFGFAAICLIALVVVVWRTRRSRSRRLF